MWVAREAGAALVGVDPSSVAVEHANDRRAAFGLEDRAGFTGVEVSEHPDWQVRQAAVFEAALAFDAAAAESDTGLRNLRREAEIALPRLSAFRRVLISAGKGQAR